MIRMKGNYQLSRSHFLRSLTLMILVLFITACTSSGLTTSKKSSVNRKNSSKAMVHAKLAESYLKLKQYAVARDELEAALKLDSRHSESNYVMALLMVELQQYSEAEKYFEQAVKSNQKNSVAAHDYGTLLCQIGKERLAVYYFDIAAKNPLFNKVELSYMRAGECLARIGDSGAEVYLKRALAINSKMRPALYQLALIKYNKGFFLSARAYIERYFAITKPQPASLLLAYEIELKLNASDVANDYRQELLDDFPGSEQAHKLRRDVQSD